MQSSKQPSHDLSLMRAKARLVKREVFLGSFWILDGKESGQQLWRVADRQNWESIRHGVKCLCAFKVAFGKSPASKSDSDDYGYPGSRLTCYPPP